MKHFRYAGLLVILSLILAACAPAATPDAPAAVPVTAATNVPMSTNEPMATAAATAASVATAAATADTAASQTIVDIAAADGRFKTLVAALKAAGLAEMLMGAGPFTVFAPTDEAFAKLPAGTVENLLKPENKQQLVDILSYHVVAGKVMAADVAMMTEGKTVQGQKVAIKSDMGSVYINDAKVILTDIKASNGVIHVIDSVLMPKANAGAAASAPADDIVETAVADGRFKTLVAALTDAGLVDTLKGEGPFTVFAPTDEAFAKLPAGTLDMLMMAENKAQLASILTYHVVAGKVMAADVAKMTEAKTVQGQPVKIRVENGKVYVNDAQVLITDIETSNGIIHVIDTVLMPPK